MPRLHESVNEQEAISVAGAGVFVAVADDVRVNDAVTDGVNVPDREGVAVFEGVGVDEAEPPVVIDDVGVAEGEQGVNTERPATSQQVHGIGAADASGQKFPTGQIVGAITPLAQKLPAGQGSVATVQRMPAATFIVSE